MLLGRISCVNLTLSEIPVKNVKTRNAAKVLSMNLFLVTFLLYPFFNSLFFSRFSFNYSSYVVSPLTSFPNLFHHSPYSLLRLLPPSVPPLVSPLLCLLSTQSNDSTASLTRRPAPWAI